MAKIIIFGTGDIAQIANYYFRTDSEHEVVAFTVNQAYLDRESFEDLPVVPFENIEKIYPPDQYSLFIALSYSKLNKVRTEKFFEAKEKGYKLVSYISSKCSYMSQYPCGENCFIFEDNTIQPYVKMGDNITLWSGNHIGHHSTLKSHSFISSHVVISGHCTIGSFCFLGVNATLHNGVEIADENIIAAGAIIAKSTEPKDLWLPARSVRSDKKTDEINF